MPISYVEKININNIIYSNNIYNYDKQKPQRKQEILSKTNDKISVQNEFKSSLKNDHAIKELVIGLKYYNNYSSWSLF